MARIIGWEKLAGWRPADRTLRSWPPARMFWSCPGRFSFRRESGVVFGLIFLVEGDRAEISIREVDKLAGALLPLEAMRSYYLDMESWSQLIFDHLAGQPSRTHQLLRET